ncbi:MAG: biotin--[acetyl-CoA-carboxylase] ligase [Desulfobacteraceae bacterium]|nr:biotin--[acetyl-CoA-carboxylase] ligase [Desulfobacteraceae bacterium]
MKSRILALLREKGAVISGECISDVLGISRVSVWKHIRKLQELGYPIRSSAKGYQMDGDFDALYPWEFSHQAYKIYFHQQLPSTMDAALELARNGCDAFTVVIAEQQAKGRGRLNRVWHSTKGGLYFTLVLRPEISPVFLFQINFAVALCIVQMLNELFGIEAGIKWPNDILVGKKKICGMLSQMEAEAEHVSFLNVGIGLNVNNLPSAVEPGAISIFEILGTKVARRKILSDFLARFEAFLNQNDIGNILVQWRQCSLTLGRTVRVVTTNNVVEGRAIDIDENGGLTIRLADGTEKTVVYGDCFH